MDRNADGLLIIDHSKPEKSFTLEPWEAEIEAVFSGRRIKKEPEIKMTQEASETEHNIMPELFGGATMLFGATGIILACAGMLFCASGCAICAVASLAGFVFSDAE